MRALVTERSQDGAITSSVQTIDGDLMPQGNVTVRIAHAGFNYKDGLCLTGAGGLVKTYPHVAGIDFAGVVEASDDPRYLPGDKGLLTGWRVGETRWGGFAELARVDADWLVPMPKGLDSYQTMSLGTAGLTAMLAIGKLQASGVTPDSGEMLVTGAGGGVGSLAVLLLSKLGHRVVALSGRPELTETLKFLGAAEVLSREDLLGSDKPLEGGRWAGAIDAVGGTVLARVLAQMRYDGVVAAVGNAGGVALGTTVLPFILRGVSLLGVDSVMQPYEARVTAWAQLAEIMDFERYGAMVSAIGLDDVPNAAQRILAGQVRGKLVVDLAQR